jgi:hypothetical protein
MPFRFVICSELTFCINSNTKFVNPRQIIEENHTKLSKCSTQNINNIQCKLFEILTSLSQIFKETRFVKLFSKYFVGTILAFIVRV